MIGPLIKFDWLNKTQVDVDRTCRVSGESVSLREAVQVLCFTKTNSLSYLLNNLACLNKYQQIGNATKADAKALLLIDSSVKCINKTPKQIYVF